jgi:hypothetical protein
MKRDAENTFDNWAGKVDSAECFNREYISILY